MIYFLRNIINLLRSIFFKKNICLLGFNEEKIEKFEGIDIK